MSDLTARQSRFVDEYIVDHNATQAAIRAGYAEKSASVEGSRLLGNAKVAAQIADRQKTIAERLGITKERVLTELAKIAFADIRKAIKWNGHLIRTEDNPDGGDTLVITTQVTNHVTLLDSDEIDDDTAGAIAQISQNATGGVSLKMHDKRSALVDLGKHIGLVIDKVEHSGNVTLTPTLVYENMPDAGAK